MLILKWFQPIVYVMQPRMIYLSSLGTTSIQTKDSLKAHDFIKVAIPYWQICSLISQHGIFVSISFLLISLLNLIQLTKFMFITRQLQCLLNFTHKTKQSTLRETTHIGKSSDRLIMTLNSKF